MGKKSKDRQADKPPVTASAPERDAALERSLAEVIAGFALLDTELEIAPKRLIHLVGVDAAGALVLGLSVAGDRSEVLLDVLDVIAFERRFGQALRRHLEDRRLIAERGTRVVLIAESYSEEVLERLAALRDGGVEPYELRAIKSKRRTTMFLVRADGQPNPDGPGEDFAELVSRQASDAQGLARRLAARLRRLDPNLSPSTRGQTAMWTVGGLPLVQLDLDGDLPRVRLGNETSRPLADEGELEILLDEVVGVYGKLCEEADPLSTDLATELGSALQDEAEVADAGPGPDEDDDWV